MTPDEIIAKAKPVWDLEMFWRSRGLSPRAANVLAVEGMKTEAEVQAFGIDRLLRLPYCGKVTADAIMSTLFPPAPEPPPPNPYLRLECLRLALTHHSPADALTWAERYWNFVNASENASDER